MCTQLQNVLRICHIVQFLFVMIKKFEKKAQRYDIVICDTLTYQRQYSGSNTTYLREVALAVSADLLCDACLSCTDLKCDSKSSPSYGDLAGNDLKK